MQVIKYFDDESYIDDILDIINEFESFQFISKELKEIINTIDKEIKEIVIDNSDELYPKLKIKLYCCTTYGFNYDDKNYPLISFNTENIIVHGSDTIVEFDNGLIINLSEFKFENFCIIE